MLILFCSDYWNAGAPDSAYEAEARSAEKAKFSYSLIDSEALFEQRNAVRAIRRIPPADTQEEAIYRGWMLKPPVYAQFFSALAEKGIRLINTPAAYTHCHYLPESYPLIEEITPRTVWLKTGPEVNMDQLMRMLQPFGDKPIIVKDFVKSRKHEWNEACYIPSASDSQAVERVVKCFLSLQGDDLNEGLVFREFVEFEPLTVHSRSGMPLIKEYRLFVLNGQIVFSVPYWEEGNYGTGQEKNLPIDLFQRVAQRIENRFFTMDVAQKKDGIWNIVELGDGQVAGLPARADVQAFYQAIAAHLS